MKHILIPTIAIAASASVSVAGDDAKADVPVRIAKWHGDAKGAVSLYYDDGTESSFRNVVPELVRRGLPGTFYICCGWFKGEDDPKLTRWSIAKEQPDTIFLGDHTWAHCGVTNAVQFADEIKRNGALLRRLAGLPEDAPLSFALPGGVPWKISKEEQAKVLADHHEVLRHDFGSNIGGPKDGKNPNFSMRTADDAIKALDRAEEKGRWEPLLFHGVGGDWITFDLDDHGKMLDELERRAKDGRLWVGSAIDVHRYVEARDATRIADVHASEAGLDFKVETDSQRSYPLTLICNVPESWSFAKVDCTMTSSGQKPVPFEKLPVTDGRILFDLPVGCVGVSVRKAD